MYQGVAQLIIPVKIYSFQITYINYTYRIDIIKNIDKETIKYNSEQDFFNTHKEKILKDIENKKDKYGISMSVVDIELGENGIYILKQNKIIRSLFKNIKTVNGTIALEDIVKYKMRNNNLEILYDIDKMYRCNDNYESIFRGCNNEILEYLEEGFVIPAVDRTWTFLNTKNRFCEIIRFLLLDKTKEEMTILFPKIISPFENPKINLENEEITRNYRLPYKDD
jgi:hypothetical protein